MHNDQIDGNEHEETRAKYKALEEYHLAELAKARAVLTALGEESEEEEVSTSGALPPIFDVQEYLEKQGKPCHQRDIIKAVGDKRKEMYPHLRHPYADVWKSLEYHDRHDRDVVCVEVREEKIVRAELKPKPRRPRIKGGGIDRAEFYASPDNLFWFPDRIEEMKR